MLYIKIGGVCLRFFIFVFCSIHLSECKFTNAHVKHFLAYLHNYDYLCTYYLTYYGS